MQEEEAKIREEERQEAKRERQRERERERERKEREAEKAKEVPALNLEDIEGERNPGTAYGIYVNLPEGASPAEAQRHHVGNLSFFGIEQLKEPRGDEQAHGLRYTVDISDFARELAARGQWNEDALHVSFRPIEPIDPEAPEEEQHALPQSLSAHAPVQVGRVSVFYG